MEQRALVVGRLGVRKFGEDLQRVRSLIPWTSSSHLQLEPVRSSSRSRPVEVVANGEYQLEDLQVAERQLQQ